VSQNTLMRIVYSSRRLWSTLCLQSSSI